MESVNDPGGRLRRKLPSGSVDVATDGAPAGAFVWAALIATPGSGLPPLVACPDTWHGAGGACAALTGARDAAANAETPATKIAARERTRALPSDMERRSGFGGPLVYTPSNRASLQACASEPVCIL